MTSSQIIIAVLLAIGITVFVFSCIVPLGLIAVPAIFKASSFRFGVMIASGALSVASVLALRSSFRGSGV
jgi:hypothetical protein